MVKGIYMYTPLLKVHIYTPLLKLLNQQLTWTLATEEFVEY